MTPQSSEFSDHPDDEGDKWSVGHHLRSAVIFKSRLKCKTQISGLLNEAENIDKVNVKGFSLLNTGYYPQTSVLVSVLGLKNRMILDTQGQGRECSKWMPLRRWWQAGGMFREVKQQSR